MSSLDLGSNEKWDDRPRWLPSTAALLAGSGTAWLVSSLPVVRALSGIDLIASALGRLLTVFLVCAATGWVLATVSTGLGSRAARRLALRTALTSLWLVPLALLIRERSEWAMLMAAVFVASTVQFLRSFAGPSALDMPPEEPRPDTDLFALPPPSLRQQSMTIGAAFCAEAGVVAGFAGYLVPGVILAGASSAVWTMSYASASDSRPSSTVSQSSSPSLVFALAILVTTLGLLPYLRVSYGLARFGLAVRHHSHSGFPQGGRRTEEGTGPPSGDLATGPSDGHSGVVLWPDQQTHTKLVAPSPVLASSVLLSAPSANPLVIPFDGVYWVFKSPDLRPPKTSKEVHGTPELYEIHSTDRRPLVMEARENFGSLIDLNCCSRIEVAIRNQDRYPKSVSLELVLIDSTAPGKPSQSLGRMTVQSTPAWHIYEKPAPTSETLDFPIPAKAAIRRFDEAQIVFRLDSWRSDSGARISIDRLVLIPRGM